MRYCVLPVIFVILGACSYNSPQPASTPSPTVEVEQTLEVIPEVQFVQVTRTLTPVPVDKEVEKQPTVVNRAFEEGLPLAARVNDEPIFLDTYEKQVAQFVRLLKTQGVGLSNDEGRATLNQIQQQVLDGLVEQLIIEQQASNLGITVAKNQVEVKAQEAIAQFEEQGKFETWLANNNLTYREFITNLHSQLIANQLFEHITQNVPETAEQIRLRVIRVEDKATAQTIIEQLRIGASFTDLARTQSLNKIGRTNGHDLDWFPKKAGVAPAEVETVAFLLQPGEVSGPIQSPTGFYIIKLENREAERPLTSDMLYIVKKQIFADWLLEQRSSTTIERYVAL